MECASYCFCDFENSSNRKHKSDPCALSNSPFPAAKPCRPHSRCCIQASVLASPMSVWITPVSWARPSGVADQDPAGPVCSSCFLFLQCPAWTQGRTRARQAPWRWAAPLPAVFFPWKTFLWVHCRAHAWLCLFHLFSMYFSWYLLGNRLLFLLLFFEF